MKTNLETIEAQKKEIRKKNEQIWEINKQMDKALEVITLNNNKTLANMKLMVHFFPGDQGIQETVNNYVIKSVNRYD